MELFKPEDEVGNQEVAHLITAVVEDQRAPLLVLADPRIAVLIEVAAIEKGQAVGVFREVPGNPIEDHANAFGVAAVHEGAEFVERAKAAGGGIEARHLIAPGAIEGVLRHRHQLDVGEAAGFHIGDHPISQLGVGEQAGARLEIGSRHRGPRGAIGFDEGLIPAAVHPAAHVHLVHRDGLLERVAVVALLQPGVIAPLVALEVGHHGGLSWAHLVLEAVGVGLLVAVPLLGVDLVFVLGASTEARHKQFPNATDPLLHRQVAAIPVGAVTNHRDTTGVGSP